MSKTPHPVARHLGARLDLPANSFSLIAVTQCNLANPEAPPRIMANGLFSVATYLMDDHGQPATHLLCDLDHPTTLTLLSEARAQAFIDLSRAQQYHPEFPDLMLDLQNRWLSIPYLRTSNLPMNSPYVDYQALLKENMEYKGKIIPSGTVWDTYSEDEAFDRIIEHSSHLRFSD